jgi:hypothetical protein
MSISYQLEVIVEISRVKSDIRTMSFLFFCLIGFRPAHSVSYYLSSDGDDAMDGLSDTTAWRSLQKTSSITLNPGDTILLRRGDSWTGECLSPRGNGRPGAPVTIDAYGNAAEKPLINAKETSLQTSEGRTISAGLYLRNASWWSIRNLEIRNTDNVPDETVSRDGIRLEYLHDDTIFHSVKILDCVIRDIDGLHNRSGSPGSFYNNGGIIVQGFSYRNLILDTLLIQGCELYDVDAVGLRIRFAGWDAFNGGETYHSWITNLVVRDTRVERTGADGMIIQGTRGALVTGNVCLDAGYHGDGTTDYIAGMWTANSDSSIFEFNEVARTRRFRGDGTAFDVDWSSTGAHIFQYNYTHENEGGFLMDFERNRTPRIIVRYNVSVNDKGSVFKTKTDRKSPVHFYNNVFYNDRQKIRIVEAARDSCRFTNNIFYFTQDAGWSSNIEFNANCYYPFTPPSMDTNAISADPLFTAAGDHGEGYENAFHFMLREGSHCIDKGVVVTNNGGRDFKGTILDDSKVSIGAFEMPPATSVEGPGLSIYEDRSEQSPRISGFGRCPHRTQPGRRFDLNGRQISPSLKTPAPRITAGKVSKVNK